jgi:hypothetical protein
MPVPRDRQGRGRRPVPCPGPWVPQPVVALKMSLLPKAAWQSPSGQHHMACGERSLPPGVHGWAVDGAADVGPGGRPVGVGGDGVDVVGVRRAGEVRSVQSCWPARRTPLPALPRGRIALVGSLAPLWSALTAEPAYVLEAAAVVLAGPNVVAAAAAVAEHARPCWRLGAVRRTASMVPDEAEASRPADRKGLDVVAIDVGHAPSCQAVERLVRHQPGLGRTAGASLDRGGHLLGVGAGLAGGDEGGESPSWVCRAWPAGCCQNTRPSCSRRSTSSASSRMATTAAPWRPGEGLRASRSSTSPNSCAATMPGPSIPGTTTHGPV